MQCSLDNLLALEHVVLFGGGDPVAYRVMSVEQHSEVRYKQILRPLVDVGACGRKVSRRGVTPGYVKCQLVVVIPEK